MITPDVDCRNRRKVVYTNAKASKVWFTRVSSSFDYPEDREAQKPFFSGILDMTNTFPGTGNI